MHRGSTERVTGVEPATLCLASTRSSQLSYTRKSEEVLVAPRVLRVNQWPKVVRTTQGAREGCPYFHRLPVARHRDDGRSRGYPPDLVGGPTERSPGLVLQRDGAGCPGFDG